jgi:hypothetical protein
LPDPPPKLLQCTPLHGRQPVHGRAASDPWAIAAFRCAAAGASFLIPLGIDLLLSTGQLVRRRDMTDRAGQANGIGVFNELGDQEPIIFQAQRRLDADALSFQSLEPALHLAMALGGSTAISARGSLTRSKNEMAAP